MPILGEMAVPGTSINAKHGTGKSMCIHRVQGGHHCPECPTNPCIKLTENKPEDKKVQVSSALSENGRTLWTA
jgi:hypothetical protein